MIKGHKEEMEKISQQGRRCRGVGTLGLRRHRSVQGHRNLLENGPIALLRLFSPLRGG